MGGKKESYKNILTVIFTVISLAYVFPVVLVLLNSFKKKTSINLNPFAFPNAKSYVGFDNYIKGIEKIEFSSISGIVYLSRRLPFWPFWCSVPCAAGM